VFQLALQFKPWDASQYDDLVALEERLITALGSHGSVDGHDAGSDEANIFILAEHPTDILEECLPIIQDSGFGSFSAGCRALTTDDYQRLWPPGDCSPFVVK